MSPGRDAPGRSCAPAHAAKTALFAAAYEVRYRKNRQETIFSNKRGRELALTP
jgi:hypothetical protein